MTASSQLPIHRLARAEAQRAGHAAPDIGHAVPGPSVTCISDYRAGDSAVADHRRPVLSSREVEVLLAWLAAESKDEAASSLFISASTVSTHLARIRAKYSAIGRDAPTKTHLLARALQDGYTSLDRW